MHSVEVRLPTHKLSRRLVSMREWLDGRGYQPSGFRYECDGDEAVVVHVIFKTDKEAVELADELGGVVVESCAASVHHTGQDHDRRAFTFEHEQSRAASLQDDC
jgi:hypothetical protein